MSERFVIIGGQAAGMSAASQAKRRAPKSEIVVFEAGTDISSLLCGLPYFLGGVVERIDDLTVVSRDEFTDKRRINVQIQHDVLSIDVKERRLRVLDKKNGEERIEPFDKLCIAAGAHPTIPEMAASGLDGVFHLRMPADAVRIRRYIKEHEPRTAVVVGAGYLGLELAENLALLGLTVTLVERLSEVMGNIGREIGQLVAQTLSRNGVGLRLDADIGAVDGTDRARCVRVAGGGDIDADLVVFATGIAPTSGLGLEAGLAMGASGSIRVDDRQRTSADGVFAAGDCCEARHLITGEPVYFPLGTTANKQGRVAGANAVGGDEIFHGVVGTQIVRVFGLEVARTGLTRAEAIKAGFSAMSKTIKANSRANYFPGGGEVFVKIVFDQTTGRILGAQIAGQEGVKGRIDVFVAAITAKMSVSEFADLDLAYAPPFSPVWDPVLIASNVAKRNVRGES
ncbi:MAG: FAD-dependent oxidoreductase [Deltaproteobacteria bacterium]|nr:FAD-dependent oxidoreductase [Deltaproteobacteria bacterium]